MDFKKLISHIEGIDGPIDTPKAPKTAEPVRLDEDTEFRVLAGLTPLTESVLAEKAVSKSQQKAAGAALAAKRGEGKAKGASKEMSKMDTKDLKKFAGTKHKGLPDKKKKSESIEESEKASWLDPLKAAQGKETGIKKDPESERNRKKPYGSRSDEKTDDQSKGKKNESVKEGEKASWLDPLKAAQGKETGIKKDPESERNRKKPYGSRSDEKTDDQSKGKKNESIDVEKFRSKFTSMVEAKKSKPDFLDKDGNKKESMKKAAADKKKGAVKDEKTSESKMMPKGKKRPVKESVDRNLSFKEMMNLVIESGGQQQIDPVDTALFDWATRVAKQKLGEGMKAEVYAGMVYEKMGGRFQMYDTLTENVISPIEEQGGDVIVSMGTYGRPDSYKDVKVSNPRIQLGDNGMPILIFDYPEQALENLKADFKDGKWVADMS